MEPFLQLCEPASPYPDRQRVLERLLHCIWSEQLFRKTLTVENKQLLISSPGWWNLEAGPDFRSAEIFLNGERLAGDVEIHLSSGDWYQHRHHEDARYNNVILHVVLYRSDRPCIRKNGEPVPELELKDHLLEELRLLQTKIPIHEFPFGPQVNVRLCRRFLDELDGPATERLMDSAGRLRMRVKKDRFLERMKAAGFEQALYEGIMEAMGYKQSRYAFRELARRLTYGELMSLDLPNRRGIDAMASAMLGIAGLLEDFAQVRMQPSDPETGTYLDDLFRHWRKSRERFAARRMTGFCWYPSSTRPANFPARRLTAVAAFLHYHGAGLRTLLQQPLEHADDSPASLRAILRRWQDLFRKPLHLYWSYHYQFEHRRFTAPKRLIGLERARILTVNVILPCLLALAEINGEPAREPLLDALYRIHPRLGENSITRLMEHRLFGTPDRARAFVRSAFRQQALHHFFYDFCDNREASCSRCELANPKIEEE